MKFLRLIRYIVRYNGKMPTGEIDEQNLIYQKIEGGILRGTWQLKYDSFYFSSSDHLYENQRFCEPIFNENDSVFAPYVDKNPVVETIFRAIEIKGAFTYEGDDYLKDNFQIRFALKQKMQRGLQEIFDAARSQIDQQVQELIELKKKYEHLPVRG